MNRLFDIINIDEWGTNSVVKPEGCTDWQSDEHSADFIGKNKKVLLRIVSKHKGYANDVAREIFNNDL